MDEQLKLENQLCFALYDAARMVAAGYQSALEPFGLTYTQFLVLLVLFEQDGMTVSALGARLHLDSGTLSPLLKRLAERGHIERRRDSLDGRAVTVALTDAGRDLQPHIAAMHRCLAERPALPQPELIQLRDLAQRFTESARSATAFTDPASMP